MSFSNTSDTIKLSQDILEEYKQQCSINKDLEIKLFEKRRELEEKEEECDNGDIKINRLRQICHNLIERNNISDKIIKIFKNSEKHIDGMKKANLNYFKNIKFVFFLLFLNLCINLICYTIYPSFYVIIFLGYLLFDYVIFNYYN